MFFPSREIKKEIMDDHSISGETMYAALNELETINKYLGGVQSTNKGIELVTRGYKNTARFSILDLGSGFSDVFNNTRHQLDIIHLDINAGIMKRLKSNNPDAKCICADALIPCMKEKSCDIIHLSLFLHHLTESEINILLANMSRIARIGIIINDLRRNILAYLGIRLLTSLFSKSEMVKNDGPLSVRKGFVKTDLTILLKNFEPDYTIRRKWAFRWLICINLEDPCVQNNNYED